MSGLITVEKHVLDRVSRAAGRRSSARSEVARDLRAGLPSPTLLGVLGTPVTQRMNQFLDEQAVVVRLAAQHWDVHSDATRAAFDDAARADESVRSCFLQLHREVGE